MDVKELRIGNWVYFKFKDTGFGNVMICANDFKVMDRISTDDIDTHYNPISLTEEWLLKFGFKKQWTISGNLYSIKLSKGFISIYSFEDDSYKLDCANLCISAFKYIHQLQNLYFALTGQELTTKTNI